MSGSRLVQLVCLWFALSAPVTYADRALRLSTRDLVAESSTVIVAHDRDVRDSVPACQELHPQETPTADGVTYALEEGVPLVFGRDESLDTESDYGQRAMLYTSERGVVQRTYFSSGIRDSYAMLPNFFRDCGPHELLILADVASESVFGLRVFAYDGKTLRDLGEIPIAVRGEGNMDSAIPFVKLTPHDQVIDLTLTTDVIKDPESRSQRPVAAKDVLYQIGVTSVRAK